ncbi:MAG: TetR/AcrR family transcriptional regulator [Roseiflexaceae bacterium]|nr:TetR/AcrR family transcriptional regulator [Roseiflexaceae bacterium]
MQQSTGVRRERRDMVRNLERVLAAAGELFAERGSSVTMEEVARRAGVGVGTVYRRFPSKEHLFAAISHDVCYDTRQSLQQAAASCGDARMALAALVRTLYRCCEQQPALLDPAPSQDDGTAAQQRELYAAVYEMLQHTIAEGQRAAIFAAGDPDVRAALCMELLTPQAFRHLSRLTGGSVEQVADHVTQFLLNGLE